MISNPQRLEAFAARLIALAVALALAAFYCLSVSADPLNALAAFFLGPVASGYNFLGLFEATSPLLLCAVGAGIAFRAGAFNLGGEGQAAVGTLVAGLVAGALGRWAIPVEGFQSGEAWKAAAIIVAAVGAASAAGGFLAFLSGAAERWSGADLLLTSFLLSQTALVMVDWAVGGPLRDQHSNLLAMPALASSLRLPLIAPPSPLSLAAPVALGAAILAAFAMDRTRSGYELRLFGRNRNFALASGLDPAISVRAMTLSGAFAGMAGAMLVLGPAGRTMGGMTGGIGWNGLAAALVAGSDPLGAVPASLFFAWLDSGARQSSILADLSPDSSAVMKAAVLFLITAKIGKAWIPLRTWSAGRAGRGL